MLRHARWLLPIAIVAIAIFTARTYIDAKRQQKLNQPKAQIPLPENLAAKFDEGWTYKIMDGTSVKVLVRAKSIEMVKEPSNYLLRDVEIELHKKGSTKFDLVKSPSTSFDTTSGSMFSESEVEISMGHDENDAEPRGRIVKIWAAGVTFETKTNRAATERHTRFELDNGSGESMGATYEANLHELHLLSQVKLDWRSKNPQAPPMHLETGELTYKENDKLILMGPWARLTRGKSTLESGNGYVFLEKGSIDRVEARDAKGSDTEPGRLLEYDAPNLTMRFGDKSQLEKIEAEAPAHIVSTSAAAVTTMTARRVDLEFTVVGHDSVLRKAFGQGQGRIESRPIVKPGQQQPDTRVLTSDAMELFMREGGKEIEKVLTHAPGTMEFLPNRPGQKKRRLDAERMTILYGAENRLQSFQAVTARTRSEREVKGKPVTTLTSSRVLNAEFDPRTGQMMRMEQTGDFTYEEGTRKAKADNARLDQLTELINLSKGARAWDETGSTSADEIVIDQQAGSTIARGNVSSTRLPDRKKKTSGTGLIDTEQPTQARAPVMIVSDDNKKIRYEGGAVLWQGGRRLTANSVFIDSGETRLEARGNVVTELPDTGPKNAYTKVRAPELDYDDKQKLALYRGGAVMERSGLEVKAAQLRAYFREEKTGERTQTQIDHLFADGKAEFIERMPDRTRRGGADHGEYWLADERMLLTGGDPYVNDTKRGITRGARIEWWAKQDRLKVDNTGSGPAVSRVTGKQ